MYLPIKGTFTGSGLENIGVYVTELNELGLEDVDDAHAKEFVLQCYQPAIEIVLNSDNYRGQGKK